MLVISALASGLLLGAVYALFAIGLNLQYGVARVMNLASGDVTIVGAFLALFAFTALGLSPLVALVPAAALAGIACFALHALLILPLARRAPNPGRFELDTILTTFGLLFIIQGTLNLIAGGGYQTYSYLAVPVAAGGLTLPANRLAAAGCAVLLTLSLYLLLSRTRLGLAVRAVAIGPVAAPLVGIDVVRIAGLTFAVGGAIAAGAGVLLSMFLAFNPSMGVIFTMKALVVVVMGGVGNLPGTLAAGLLLGVAEALTTAFLDPALSQVVSFALFMLVLSLRPEGLFGAAR